MSSMCTTGNNGNNRNSNSRGCRSASMSLAPNQADNELTPRSKAADRDFDDSDILSKDTAPPNMIDSREDCSSDNLNDDSKQGEKITRSNSLIKERSHALVCSPPRAILRPPPRALVQNIVNVEHNMMGRKKRERALVEDGDKDMMQITRRKRRKCTHGGPVRIVPESKAYFYKVVSGCWFDKWRSQEDIVEKAKVAAEKKREIANQKAYMEPAADRAEMEVQKQASLQNEMFDGFARAAMTNILSDTRKSRRTVEEDMLKEMKERGSIDDKMGFMSDGQYDPVRVGSHLFKAERHLHGQSKNLDEVPCSDVENHARGWASSWQGVSRPSIEQAAKGSTQLHDETLESREELRRVLQKTTEELDANLIEIAKLDAFEDTVEYGRKLLEESEQTGKETSLRTFTRALKERCRRRQELLDLLEL